MLIIFWDWGHCISCVLDPIWVEVGVGRGVDVYIRDDIRMLYNTWYIEKDTPSDRDRLIISILANISTIFAILSPLMCVSKSRIFTLPIVLLIQFITECCIDGEMVKCPVLTKDKYFIKKTIWSVKVLLKFRTRQLRCELYFRVRVLYRMYINKF